MDFACPGCGRRYKVRDDRAPTARFRCAICTYVGSVADAIARADAGPAAARAEEPAAAPRPRDAESKKTAPARPSGDVLEFPPADATAWRAAEYALVACLLLLCAILYVKVAIEPLTPRPVEGQWTNTGPKMEARADVGGVAAAFLSLAVAGALLAYAAARVRTRIRVSEDAYVETSWLGTKSFPLDELEGKHVTFAPDVLVLLAPCVWTWPKPLEVPATAPAFPALLENLRARVPERTRRCTNVPPPLRVLDWLRAPAAIALVWGVGIVAYWLLTKSPPPAPWAVDAHSREAGRQIALAVGLILTILGAYGIAKE